METDPPPRWLRRSHELPNRVEDGSNLLTVTFYLALQLRQFLGKLRMAGQYFPKPNKNPHDRNVHLDGPFAVQNAGKHGYSLLGKSVGEVASTAVG